MNHRRAGFRKIENDIFEALVTAGLSGAGYQVVLTIIDLTLGYRKGSEYRQWAKIPLTRFEQATGLSRQSVRLGVRQAEGRYIIKAERNSTRPTKYALNPNIGEWVTRKQNHHSELDNGITPDWETKSPQTRKPVISRTIDIKETTKENIKERTTLPNELSGEVHHPTPAKEMSLTLCTPKGKA